MNTADIDLDFDFVPLSVNALYRIARRGLYKTAKWHQLKDQFLTSLPLGLKPIELHSPIAVSIHMYYSDRRKRDIDNPLKALLDLGNGTLWADDSQIVQLSVHKLIDRNRAHTRIAVHRLAPDLTPDTADSSNTSALL